MNKTLYWWKTKNFGDAINPYIQKSFGVEVKYAGVNEADMVSVGSVLEHFLERKSTNHKLTNSKIYVWGAGFHYESGKNLNRKDIVIPERFVRTVNIKAVRGKYSLYRLEQILGQKINASIGDPALLTSRIFDMSIPRKKHDVGIVGHFSEKNSKIIQRLQKEIPGSTIIDVELPPVRFIEKILETKLVLSTALHPLIIADSYGIPNKWINFSDKNVSKYKFHDYYSVFDMEPDYLDINHESINIDTIIEEYNVPQNVVEKIQNDLIRSHPFSNSIKKLKKSDIFWFERSVLLNKVKNKLGIG